MSDHPLPAGFRLNERDGVRWIEVSLGPAVARFTLAFDASGERIDLGWAGGSPDVEARSRVAGALGLDPGAIRLLRQVHGGEILGPGIPDEAWDGAWRGQRPPPFEADGVVSNDQREVLAVQVADCLPVAVTGPRGRALLHLGWRSLATDMLERAVGMVDGEEAVIGPSIGSCCYEVGSEVAAALGTDLSPQHTIDLPRLARNRLTEAGVGRVLSTGLCTSCEEALFFSFRRQAGQAGRQMAFLSVG